MYGFRPYVSVAKRRSMALREMKKLSKKGHPVAPVVIEGRTIASSFWGKAWCDNLESYSDFENRLPRGRTYVRNGSVVDLQIAPGEVQARVAGSELYRVTIGVSAVPPARWSALCRECSGAIDSLVELLQGRFAAGVMERICRQQGGLFPAPSEIDFSCDCPDWADMCKHVAAVLYGIGARLDQRPELLFALRKVDHQDLITTAGAGLPLAQSRPASKRLLGTEGLSELFGLDLAAPSPEPAAPRALTAKATKKATTKKKKRKAKTKAKRPKA